MLYPFAHVSVNDMEFILRHRVRQPDPSKGVAWHAYDMYMNKVTISESFMRPLPSQCTFRGEWLHVPKFYIERKQGSGWTRHPLKHTTLAGCVRRGCRTGQFHMHGKTWTWSTESMDAFHDSERWLLRVMTPGGIWI